jgi:release factor glutamine methyltransferase
MRELLKTAKAKLREAQIDSYALDAEVLLTHVLGITRSQLILNIDRLPISENERELFINYIARRAKSEPIAYITNIKEFWGRDFYVDQSVLIPRPDTEVIIVAAKQYGSSSHVLDLGTGSGCLAVTMALELPACHVVAVDVSDDALAVAMKNAITHGVQSRVSFLKSDWFSALAHQQFDMIVSNPPYIETSMKLMPDVMEFEPGTALFSGDEGLDSYREIAKHIDEYLRPEGVAIFEIGMGQAEAVTKIFSSLKLKEIKRDIQGIERTLVFIG